MITEISDQVEDELEKDHIDELIKDFNVEAKKSNSEYRIEMVRGYPFLFKRIIFNLGIVLYKGQIHYNIRDDMFSFVYGLDDELFEEIRNILAAIEQKFYIVVRKRV